MRARFVASLVLCFVAAEGLLGTPALAADPPGTRPITVTRGGQTFQRATLEVESAPDGRLMRAGSLIVKFRSRASTLNRDEAHRLAGALAVERLLSTDTVRIQVGRSRSSSALATYLSHPAVEHVDLDYVASPILTPNDPFFGQQWGMAKIRAGTVSESTAQSAWDISTSSAAVRVAILDCGVFNEGSSTYLAPDGSPGHPDLRPDALGTKVIDNLNFTTSPDADDWCNHGTHVAGIAAANTDNGKGVAGVGHRARIRNIKVLDDGGSGSFAWIINGISYAAGCDTTPCGARRAEIINMSLGSKGSCTTSLQSAIDKAWAQGLVIVAAAGNSGKSGAITPANCNHVIGVSASDQNDAKASFSNFGSGVDVAAPGVSILSSDFVGGYSSFDGTSMASPHVAGLAALVWTTPHNTGNQAVVERIFSTADDSKLAGSVHGRIDAYLAVVQTPSAACTSATLGASPASPQSVGTTVTWTASAAGCGTPQFKFWTFAPGGPWQVVQDWSSSATYTWNTAGRPAGTHVWEVWVRAQGSSASWEANASANYTLIGADACTSATLGASPASPQSVGTTVTWTASAAGCGTPQFKFWTFAPGGPWQVVQDWSSSATYTWNTAGRPAGTHVWEVWVRAQGSSASWEANASASFQLTSQ